MFPKSGDASLSPFLKKAEKLPGTRLLPFTPSYILRPLTFYALLHFMPSYTGSSQYGRVCGLPDIRLFLLDARHKA